MKVRLALIPLVTLAIILPLFARSRAAVSTPATADTQGSRAPVFSPLEQNLIDTQKAFLDAFERGDAAYIKNAVADDCLLIGPNGDVGDKSELVDDLHPAKAAGPKPIFYDFKIVPLNESAAVVTYNAVFPQRNPERYQHLSYTWVKQDGQWKLKFRQTTLNLWSAHDL
jgi:hypothetical protein